MQTQGLSVDYTAVKDWKLLSKKGADVRQAAHVISGDHGDVTSVSQTVEGSGLGSEESR